MRCFNAEPQPAPVSFNTWEFAGFKIEKLRLLTAARSAVGMILSIIPMVLEVSWLDNRIGIMCPILVSMLLPASHRLGAGMMNAKHCLTSGIFAFVLGIPFQHVIHQSKYSFWIGLPVIVVAALLSSVILTWVDPGLVNMTMLKLGLLSVLLCVTFMPKNNTSHLNFALQILIVHLIATGIIWILASISPLVLNQVNKDLAGVIHDCGNLYQNMTDQLKLTKPDSLEDDPNIILLSESSDLLEFDVQRRREEQRIRILEKKLTNRMKVIKYIIEEAAMELWADKELVKNHNVIFKDIDMLLRELISMRIAIETGFVPRLSLVLIKPLIPQLEELRTAFQQYTDYIQNSMLDMFKVVPQKSSGYSSQISKIARSIRQSFTDNIKQQVFEGNLKISPTSEITRLNFWLWRLTDLRKRLKSLEKSVQLQTAHAVSLGPWWRLKVQLICYFVPFIGIFQGIYSFFYMIFGLFCSVAESIFATCCCKSNHTIQRVDSGSNLVIEASDSERIPFDRDIQQEIKVEMPREPEVALKGNFRVPLQSPSGDYSLHNWLQTGGWKFPVRFTLSLIISVTAALLIETYVYSGARATWAAVSVLLVTCPSVGMTFKKSIHRMIGTIVGCMCGQLTVIFAYHTHRYLIFGPILLFSFISTYIQHSSHKPRPYSWTVAIFTYMIIVFLSYPFETSTYGTFTEKASWILAGYRMLQVLIGCLIALLCSLVFPEMATEKLYRSLKSSTHKSTHAFVEMVALATSGIQETGKIEKLIQSTHEATYKEASLLKLAKAELFFDRKTRRIVKHFVRQREAITNTLRAMTSTLKAGFKAELRDWLTPYLELLLRCVLFIEEDVLLVYQYLETRKLDFRPEPTRIADVLSELDDLYFKMRVNHPRIHEMKPNLIRWNAFVHTVREFIVEINNLVQLVTQKEDHNLHIHMYSR